ncbi:phosphatidylserine decarboxylase [bacterium]|nr:phosphatidylserine decarboxylase [bacterium]
MILFSQCAGPLTIILVLLAVTLFAAVRTGRRWLRLPAVFLVPALLLTLYFFRNPDRPVTAVAGSVLSPADGTIADTAAVLREPDGTGYRKGVAIYLSLFDVHVNRIPVSGVVVSRVFQKGAFLPAFSAGASRKNEYLLLGIATDQGLLYVRQIAGSIARTIVCHAQVGDSVFAGEPYGMIKFGSRVEIFPPGDPERLVFPGAKVSAGITELFRYEHE